MAEEADLSPFLQTNLAIDIPSLPLTLIVGLAVITAFYLLTGSLYRLKKWVWDSLTVSLS